jgi:hypothetical protein
MLGHIAHVSKEEVRTGGPCAQITLQSSHGQIPDADDPIRIAGIKGGAV